MAAFVGRQRELGLLTAELGRVIPGNDHPGRCLLIRGRQRVGKSRLVEQFVETVNSPSLYFTAAGTIYWPPGRPDNRCEPSDSGTAG